MYIIHKEYCRITDHRIYKMHKKSIYRYPRKIIDWLFERLILLLGFLLVILPEIIFFTLIEIKDWIIEERG